MILLDQPYVSDFLQQSLCRYNIPVIQTPEAEALGLDAATPRISEQQAIAELSRSAQPRLYSNSEHALAWVQQNLAATALPGQIQTFKNKASFRRLLQPLYPHLFFCEVPFAELSTVATGHWPWPVIIKPAVGFFSMGVHKVESAAHWPATVAAIGDEVRQAAGRYPAQVVDTATFIVEGYLDGEEYAIDAYFDAQGQPVILNVLHHLFSSSSDVSDRIYLTSADIVIAHHDALRQLLSTLGQLQQLRNFPVHLEVRIDESGAITPIELNPLRFAGWCTTDVAWHAYAINPYHFFFNNLRPDWQHIQQTVKSRITSLILLDRPQQLAANQIESFDYARLLAQLSQPVELRKVDFHHHPLFGIVFAQTQPAAFAELTAVLKADMSDYVTMKEQ